MKLLLDTHTFIWWDSDPAKLSQKALDLLTDKDNIRLLSVVSLWEIQIKHQLGKLTLNKALREIIASQQNNHIEILPINIDHILALDNLPLYHKDPFDRLLIAQTNIENAVMISCDAIFANYSVQVEW
ncbi:MULTISPECIES: type II toxin-antitoxin system VapC family toxin [unclassified Tolypothrix]|uniref:type II toxin-antitoxin system VapC family toxin n=1 Tax=unclassified Tolypothrix TaxID=2649714 RepID=UPI0005EAC7BC|nr:MULTISPECIES: type II toxin-antitoxin system VapC family toxin [unclassified Tolypothrix]BAY89908.1 putative PilT protein [Microchaete diplosiphon NIES-3275]EKE96919.1 toxin-antitoxin system, toxin component, PIN family [Tolypothrix sp. PCC 7601]MBE9082150.1 type II toxin-antitoxin system VapC family toxin [Tolypothrix sp. LEGE 11397]UYD24145.1 type II toxin-antitoxin system VapC family toxin [Tolypothrix sp. PCC 7712]UYD33624.1 type II toxin-antitoxin system VapC family toxin [Tolypothrix 